ncbi:hypothetical protein BDZ85DRAFT_201789 [Elsinoe ampelina]|uniref:DUF6604 domain-containing protein n=1 Tax=Elsinoe ampelina TaxID=302913 RepID=A0A6A6G7L9_9PEZI|nr:hypothetical protein BDZ85DRAFT_201789 [Elsinoe ampelina]
MPSRNAYLDYKRDTAQLVYWIVHASNAITKASHTRSTSFNDNGQIKVSEIVPLCKLIVDHTREIPARVFRLFHNVIEARAGFHELFRSQLSNDDAELKKKNDSHAHFIEILTSAFHALGGREWQTARTCQTNGAEEKDPDDNLFTNYFATLSIEPSSADEQDSGADVGDAKTTISHSRRKSSRRKGKKKGKRHSNKKQPFKSEENNLSNVPLEQYRIFTEEEYLNAFDFLVAGHHFFQIWIDIRITMQEIWQQAAWGHIKASVAGALSNVAIAIVKRAALAIFADFPGDDTFSTLFDACTTGTLKDSMTVLRVSVSTGSSSDTPEKKLDQTNLDAHEWFSGHTFDALYYFQTDFQKNKTGKPTKRFASAMAGWDSKMPIYDIKDSDRIAWRHGYTLNLLYELVALTRGQEESLSAPPPKGIFSNTTGPDFFKGFPGMAEFALTTTKFAMGDIDLHQLPPHFVFQLQLIVDSMTAYCGWTHDVIKGHTFNLSFDIRGPRRELDSFMKRKGRSSSKGFLRSLKDLKNCLDTDAELHQDIGRHAKLNHGIRYIESYCNTWLDFSNYKKGLKDGLRSRFSDSSSCGLWDYSPFFCGVAACHFLEMSYNFGYELVTSTTTLSQFILLHTQQRSFRVSQSQTATKGLFKTEANRSLLGVYREAGWDPDRIPNKNLPCNSALSRVRIINASEDSSTSHPDVEDLLARARRHSAFDQEMKKAQDFIEREEALKKQTFVHAYSAIEHMVQEDDIEDHRGGGWCSNKMLLDFLKVDLHTDICGDRPNSGLHYAWLTVRAMRAAEKIERRLEERGNAFWRYVYRDDPRWAERKRQGLLGLIMRDDANDEEVFEVVIQAMREEFDGICPTFWEKLVPVEEIHRKVPLVDDRDGQDYYLAKCSVM